jgi:hypothetical protein
MTRYRVLGTTDDVTTCEICGKDDLKSTTMVATLDPDGNEAGMTYAGSDCAAKRTGWTQKQVKDAAKAADRAAAEALDALANEAGRITSRARDIALAEYVTATYGVPASMRGPWPQMGNVPARTASPYQIVKAWEEAGKPGLDPLLDVRWVDARAARRHAGHLPAGVTLATATPAQLIDALRAAQATE